MKDSEIAANEKLLSETAHALLAKAKSKPRQVSITIPKSHPDLPRLIKIAEQLATSQTLQSGITIQGLLRPGAVEEFIDALKQVVGSEPVDMLLAQIMAPTKPGPLTLADISLPQLAGFASQLLPTFKQN